jgi:Family of unknown function (DUF5681)
MRKPNPIPNSKPFQKGQSGNPNGRPKKLPGLDEILANVLGDEKNGVTAAEAILMSLRAQAMKGNVHAAKVLLERAYGGVKQDLNINHSGEVQTIDPAKLTAEQKRQLLEIYEAAAK